MRDEDGSSPVEFVLVGTMLTLLTLAVLQFALAVYVRNVVHDAAVEGAFHAALADVPLAAAADRAQEIIGRTIGDGYVEAVTVGETSALGGPAVAVTVSAAFPLVGLIGLPGGLEVTAYAPLESFD